MEIKTAVLTTHIFGGSSVCRLKKCKEGVSGSQRVGLQKSVLEENSAAAFLWRSLGVAEEDNVDGQLCILRAFRWLSTMSNNNWLVAFCVGLHVWLQWVIARHWVKKLSGYLMHPLCWGSLGSDMPEQTGKQAAGNHFRGHKQTKKTPNK